MPPVKCFCCDMLLASNFALQLHLHSCNGRVGASGQNSTAPAPAPAPQQRWSNLSINPLTLTKWQMVSGAAVLHSAIA